MWRNINQRNGGGISAKIMAAVTGVAAYAAKYPAMAL